MLFMNIIKRLKKNKTMKDALIGLFVDINASKNDDLDMDDFDFDGEKSKPFHVCYFMHNQDDKHEDYSNEYDETLDLFIPSGDVND